MLKENISAKASASLDKFLVPDFPITDAARLAGLRASLAFSWGITEITRIFGAKAAFEVLMETVEFVATNGPYKNEKNLPEVNVNEFLELLANGI